VKTLTLILLLNAGLYFVADKVDVKVNVVIPMKMPSKRKEIK